MSSGPIFRGMLDKSILPDASTDDVAIILPNVTHFEPSNRTVFLGSQHVVLTPESFRMFQGALNDWWFRYV